MDTKRRFWNPNISQIDNTQSSIQVHENGGTNMTNGFSSHVRQTSYDETDEEKKERLRRE